MKWIERILIGLVIAGVALKLMQWGFGGTILVLSLSGLSGYYMVSVFVVITKPRSDSASTKSPVQKVLEIIGAMTISILLIGILAKLEFWPIVTNLIIGLAGTAAVAVVSGYFYLVRKSKSYQLLFRRTFIYVLAGLTMYVISNNALLDLYYPEDTAYKEALKNYVNDPDNIEYQRRVEKEYIKRDSIQREEEIRNK